MIYAEDKFEGWDLRRDNFEEYPVKFDIDPRREFCAIYFPCEIGQSVDDDRFYANLKSSLLFFDKIFVVVPEIIFSDYFSYWLDMSKIDEELIEETKKFDSLEYRLWRERFKRLRSFIEQTKVAHDEGILEYVNPRQVRSEPMITNLFSLPSVDQVTIEEVDDHIGEIIFRSIVTDLNDQKFRNLVKSDYPYSEPGFAVFKDQGEFNWLIQLSGCSHYKEDEMIFIDTFVAENTIAPPPGVGFDSIVSPVLGMAVFLSHILAFCIQNPVYPVTDDLYYWKLLSHKFKRLSVNEKIRHYEEDKKLNISAIGLDVLDVELPRLALKSFEDILHIRHTSKDELIQFRLELAAFSNFSSSQIWSNDFLRECNDIAQFNVQPAINELQKSLSLSKDKVIIDAFKKLRTLSPVIPLVSTLIAGIPILYALAITAGLISVESFLDLYFERKKIRTSSGLSYILDLKKRV